MKTPINSVILLLLATTTAICRPQTNSAPAPTPYAIISRGLDWQTWQRTVNTVLPSGKVISRIQSYKELATGLNFLNPATGQLEAAKEEIDVLPDGSAEAIMGQHKAYFPTDIYSGIIKLITPDDVELRSKPACICFDDGTNAALIAELTNSVGQLIKPNEVIYTNAFNGISADLLYIYRKSGLEQDVLFRTQPPAPEQFGFDPNNVRLEVLTEFFNTATPLQATSPTSRVDDLQDHDLSFGKMRMPQGKAFTTASSPAKRISLEIPIYKSWIAANGRTFLLEAAPYRRLKSQLDTLPRLSSRPAHSPALIRQKVPTKRFLPPEGFSRTSTAASPIRIAAAHASANQRVVFDYTMVDSDSAETNFTFQGDTTYLISGQFNLFNGVTTIEGGTVIKFANDVDQNGLPTPEIDIYGPVQCLTHDYCPAILTAMDDDSVGQPISGSTGAPSGVYAATALEDKDGVDTLFLHNIVVNYAETGLTLDGTTLIQDAQFLNDQQAIYAGAVQVVVENGLFYNDAFVFNIIGVPLYAENLTGRLRRIMD